jgi:tetrapyrrole methylase family protein/MazG family protein
VVGLGPAGPAYLTSEVRDLIAGAQQAFLRTARHPAVQGLSGFVALDHLYESSSTFAQVYGTIVEELVAAATACAPETIVYAVPGSPLIAERTVELLRHDARVDLTIVPGLSFLDLAWERLALDPLEAGVRLVDAEQFARQVANDRGPFLVAQCWSQRLLSDIKLSSLYDGEGPVPEVVLLHHLGLEDEQVRRVGWWDLDRALEPDHLTALYIPEISAPAALEHEMARLSVLVETLRAECPWDKTQTHASLMPHLLEESYEVLDALREVAGAPAVAAEQVTVEQVAHGEHLCEELGDLLFQIVFHARLAEEEGLFTLADVARGVHDKLVHRHPHVFGDVDVASAQQVVANWEEIKKEEKGRTSVTEGIPTDLPALLLSTKLQRKALSVGLSAFDASATADLATQDLATQLTELTGLEADPQLGTAEATLSGTSDENEQRVGALLFGVANLARRLGVDPELALRWRALALRDEVVRHETGAPALPIPDEPTH